jgi:hypothetical protein
MRRLLWFVLALLGVSLATVALATGGTSALADSPSGPAGFSLLGGVSLLNPALAPVSGDLAPDPNGDVTCSGVFGDPGFAPPSAPHDLIVPSGNFCVAPDGTTVGHDVIVESGADFATGGITVGHDVIGDNPDAVEIGDFSRGSARSFIGHDVNVSGATSGAFLQEVCNATVDHDIIWQNDGVNAGLSVGDQDFFCFTGTDYVGHDGIFLNNQGQINEVSDNNPTIGGGGFGHDLIVQNNTNVVVESNAIDNNCEQQNDHPYTNNDGDSTGPNTAGHKIDGCNTPNS